jgi:hypothetical protein
MLNVTADWLGPLHAAARHPPHGKVKTTSAGDNLEKYDGIYDYLVFRRIRI